MLGLVVLSAFLAGGFYVGSRALLEPQCPEVTHYQVPPVPQSSPKILGPEQDPDQLRILYFSDYHHPLNRLPLEFFWDQINCYQPDAVIFGGDMTNHPDRAQEGQWIAERIASFCHDFGIVYLSTRGNHDTGLDPTVSYPFPYLVDSHYNIQTKAGTWWQIVGLEDIRLGGFDFEKALQTLHPTSPPLPKPEDMDPSRRIILAHNPDSILRLDSAQARFCLSGHFHGGQIWAPFHLQFTSLRSEILCRHGFTQGLFPLRGFWQFISRGYGNVLFPFRLGSRPELTILDFSPCLSPANSQGNDQKLRQ